jgi:MFS family permease
MTRGATPPRSDAYRWYVLFVLILTNMLAFIDRGIIGTLAQAIKKDLHLGDTELGILGGLAFAISYGPLGIPIARYADRANRARTLSAALAFWSLMTALCGLAQSYTQLLLARIGVGMGESGSTIAHPLISDHFPPERRATALGLFALGSPLGIVFGTLVAAWATQAAGWRVAFLVVGVPGLLLALLTATTVHDVPRGHSEGAVADGSELGFVRTLRFLFAKPSFLHLILAVSIFGIGLMSAGAFVQPLLIRRFDLTYTQAGSIFAASFGLAAAIGVLSGGLVADRLGRIDRRFFVWIPGAGTLLCGTMLTLAYTRDSPLGAAIFFFGAIVGSGWYMAPSWALAQHLAPPAMRATAAALIVFAMNVVASAIGPAVVGALSDHFAIAGAHALHADCTGPVRLSGASAQACAHLSAASLQTALLVVNATIFWGAAHYFWAARYVRRDLSAAVRNEAGAP